MLTSRARESATSELPVAPGTGGVLSFIDGSLAVVKPERTVPMEPNVAFTLTA